MATESPQFLSLHSYPFLGRRIPDPVPVDTLLPYLRKDILFGRQWQLFKSQTPAEEKERIIREQGEPALERLLNLGLERDLIHPRLVYGYYPCYRDHNAIVILHPENMIPWHRLNFPRRTNPPFLCLADFISSTHPRSFDILGMMLVTTGEQAMAEARAMYQENSYLEYFLWFGLISLLTESLTEYQHYRMELEIMGAYSGDASSISRPDDSAPLKSLETGFVASSPPPKARQSKRFSFGYPVCPDLNDQQTLCDILGAADIGIRLSESRQLIPENSTSALVIFNPHAHYFTV